MANLLDKIEKHNLLWFQATPYPAQIIVYVPGTKSEKALHKVFKDHPEFSDSNNGLCAFMKVDGYNIITIGVRNNLEDFMAVAAHESYHAMNVCYRWFGAYHDNDNDEMGAYFLGHIVREFTSRFAEITQ